MYLKKVLSMALVLMMVACLPVVSLGEEAERKLLTIEVYSVAANYQGLQVGWFAKALKDELGIELNIIAPQVAGDGNALYQTRTAAGALGDLIMLDNKDMQDCIQAGLVYDITDDIFEYEYLRDIQEQITLYNDSFEGNDSGAMYAIPSGIANTSPSSYSETEVYISPMMPWDYFTGIGAPEMNTLDDMLDALSLMLETYPTNSDGDKAYAFGLWADWDNNNGMETAVQLVKMLGSEVNGSIMLTNKNEIVPVTDDDGAYYKILEFFFKANQLGLVDPDSPSMTWEDITAKMSAKRYYLMWYNWQRGFWNTPERGNTREAFIYTPVAELDFYQASDNYYGDGRSWAIGSQVSEEVKDRILEFFNWFAGPDGNNYQHAGIKDFTYTVNDDGTFTRTAIGEVAYMDNTEVPEEWGGGGYYDGLNKLNHNILNGVTINKQNGTTYLPDYWPTTLEALKTTMTNEWAEMYGAANQVEYLLGTGQLNPVPSVNMNLTADNTDIELIRSQCKNLVVDTSWQMAFAADEATFNQLWENLKDQLAGFGWDELVEFDTAKYQAVIDVRNAAAE